MNESEFGITLSDALDLDLVSKGLERGHYVLTDEGRSFAIFPGHAKDDDCKEILGNPILSSRK
ncbi:MAG: hypothetical protein JW779_05585 [Candidatus Thorarchaeota archaeon]|nr:hypothetical protein [Candidatus Thorarchaeota archaeon]